MKRFLVLYKAPVEEFAKAMSSSSPDRMKQSMDEWNAWMEKNKSSFVDGGAPVGKTKKVTASAVSDIKNDIGGYSIVQAATHDDAAKMLMGSPHFKSMGNATVEVMEIMEMPGM